MKRTARNIVISVIIFVFIPTIVCSQNDNPPGETKYGALAIDRGNGFYYGWAIDCPNFDGRCNSQNAGELKVIYDAHDELKLILPGTLEDY